MAPFCRRPGLVGCRPAVAFQVAEGVGEGLRADAVLVVARRYVDAVSAKDFAAVVGLFADDILWHQPGDNAVSGTYGGGAAVGRMLAAQVTATGGTFELQATGDPMVNGVLVAIPIHFSADQQAEDAFGGVG
ncbi:nuclear transport factor 2 family protein [Streptomyces sp. NPDC002643]